MLRANRLLVAILGVISLLLLPGLSQHAVADPRLPTSTAAPTLPGATGGPTLPGAPSSSPTSWDVTNTAGPQEPTEKANLPGIDDPRWKELTPAQQKEILGKAREAAGLAVCGQIPIVKSFDKTKKKCASLVGPSFTVAKGLSAVAICGPLTALVPAGFNLIARWDCARVMVGLMEGKGWDAFKGTLMGEMGKVAAAGLKVVKFIANPMGAVDDLANATKDTAVGMSKAVLENAARSDSESLGSAQFRKDYAAGAGLGIVVAALMLLITFMQASRGAIDSDTLIESLVMRAPMGIIMILVGPAIGYALQQSVNGLSQGAASVAGTTMGEVISRLVATLSLATVAGIPGGSLAGILLFLAVIVGAVSMLITMIMVDFGLYMTSAILSVIFAMRINPLWRPKVRKVEAGWAAMLLMKPLFLLLLGFAFGFLKAKLSVTGPSATGFGLMVTIMTIAAVMMTIGFAPFAIMRHAPILPGGNEMSESGTSGAGAMLAGAAGGLMSQVAMQRSAAGGAAGRPGPPAQPNTGPPGQPGSPGKSAGSDGTTKPSGADVKDTRAPQPPQRTPQPVPTNGGTGGTSRGVGGASAAGGRSATTAKGAGAKGASAAGGPAGLAAIAVMQGAQGMQAIRAKSESLARTAAPKMGEAEE